MKKIEYAEKMADVMAEFVMEDISNLTELSESPKKMENFLDMVKIMFPLKVLKKMAEETDDEETIKEVEKREKVTRFMLGFLEVEE